MKSVTNMTGGMFGNRMYFELLRNNFNGTDIVSDVMGKSYQPRNSPNFIPIIS